MAATAKESGRTTVLHQTRLSEVLDDRIPSWKVADGRHNLFWPEWRAPYLGDVDFSGSRISLTFAPGEEPTHLILKGLVGGCQVQGVKAGYVSQKPVAQVPAGMHFLAASPLPAELTGLAVPRYEGMRLQEIIALGVKQIPSKIAPGALVTPLTGLLAESVLGEEKSHDLRVRNLPADRRLLGHGKAVESAKLAVPALGKLHLLADPVDAPVYLDAVNVQLTFAAKWQQDVWWLRVQDPVNPQRLLMEVPVVVQNSAPGQPVTLDVTLDFWDIALDAESRLRVELIPTQAVEFLTSPPALSRLVLLPGEKNKVLAEFAHTQSQLAFGYWQLGSEGGGTRGGRLESPEIRPCWVPTLHNLCSGSRSSQTPADH